MVDEAFDPVAEGLTTEGYPGSKAQDKTDYFDPLDFARPSFEAARERFMDAGNVDVNPDDPALFNAYKRSVDYLADTGMAGLELADTAFKAAVGTVAELIPGQGQEAEKRLERDLYSMPEAFFGVSPGRIQQATDTVAEGMKEFGERLNRPSQAPRSMDTMGTFGGNVYKEKSLANFLKEQYKKELDAINKKYDSAGKDLDEEELDAFEAALNDVYDRAEAEGVDLFEQVPFNPDFEFTNPVQKKLDEIEIPKKGLLGSNLKKELENDPEIRGSFLSALDLDIDPAKRYTRQDLVDLKNQASYGVFSESVEQIGEAPTGLDSTKFSSYQRQKEVGLKYDTSGPWGTQQLGETTIGRPVDYVELTVEAYPRNKKPRFKAKSQHFSEDTLAHSRFSVVEKGNRRSIVVEELQSDLLQQGYKKPQKGKSLKEAVLENTQEDNNTRLLVESIPEKNLNVLVDIVSDPFLNREERFKSLVSYYKTNQNAFEGTPYQEKLKKVGALKDEEQLGAVLNNSAFDLSMFSKTTEDIGAPPIKKTKEGVDVVLKGILQYADNNDIDEVIIPPFEKIVEARFPKGSKDYDKALDPKSGFYQTYVTSLNKSIKELQQNFPELVTIRKEALPYDKVSKLDFKSFMNILRGMSKEEKINLVRDVYPNHPMTRTDEDTMMYLNQDLQVGTMSDDHFVVYKDALRKRGYLTEGEEFFTGTVIDITDLKEKYDLSRPRFAEGGLATEEQMNKLYQEGGLADDGTEIEPVTGNEIPPGSMDQEVRDDIPARLSEGEYVLPADVVRYIGLGQIESLVQQAKEGLARMESNGRIGGEPVDDRGVPLEQDEELTPEEMQMLSEALGQTPAAPTGMAMGGMVPQQQTYNPYEQQQVQYSQPNAGMAVGGMAQPTFQSTRTPNTPVDLGMMKTYYNPETGEIRSFPPGTEVPEGFQETTNTATTKPMETPEIGGDRGNSGAGPEGAPEVGAVPSVQDMVGMSTEDFGDMVDKHNAAKSAMSGFGVGPIGMAMTAVDKAVTSRFSKALEERSKLGIEDPEDIADKIGTGISTGIKGAVSTAVEGVTDSLSDTSVGAALGLGKDKSKESATDVASRSEAASKDSGNKGEASGEASGDSGGRGGGEGGQGSQGGSEGSSGDNDSDSGMQEGGLATKPKNKPKRRTKNNKKGLASK